MSENPAAESQFSSIPMKTEDLSHQDGAANGPAVGGVPPLGLGYEYAAQHVSGSMERDITVFVACYNEEGNIVQTLDTLTDALEEVGCSWEIVVIDDASEDRSVEVVEGYVKDHAGQPISLRGRTENVGLAQNYIEAAFIGNGKYYKLVSGDNAEPRDTLVAILEHLGEADMIVPHHKRIEGRGVFRSLLSRAYTLLVNCISGHRMKYYNGGAVHLRYNVMRWHTNYHGFSFQADMITRLLDLGASYVEVSVTSQERESGRSKAVTLKNFLSVAHFLLDLAIRRIGGSAHRGQGLR